MIQYPLAKKYSLRRCPPMPASGYAPPEPIFGMGSKHPVSAEFHGLDSFSSNGLSFEDYDGAQTMLHKLATGRRSDAPSWCFNRADLVKLLVRYFELRAGIQHPRSFQSPKERLDFACRRLQAQIPSLSARLDVLSREYVEAKKAGQAERVKQLEETIRILDTRILHERLGPALVVKLIYAYYNLGFESTEIFVGDLQILPPAVRKLIMRLKQIWAMMESGTDKPPAVEPVKKEPKPPKPARTPEQLREKGRLYYASHKEAILAKQRELKQRKRGRPTRAYRRKQA